MAEPAASGIQVGVAVASGVAGVVVESLGLSMPMLAAGFAAAGLGMLNARQMPAVWAFCVWVGSSICAAWLGSGIVDITAFALKTQLPASATFLGVVLSGIAMHPIIKWVGLRLGAIADAGAAKMGVNVTTEGGK